MKRINYLTAIVCLVCLVAWFFPKKSSDAKTDPEPRPAAIDNTSYPRCEREFWKGKAAIASIAFDRSATRKTTPGPICVELPLDFVVNEAFCGISYPEPNGHKDCFLNSACPYDSSYSNFTDEVSGGTRRICVNLNRTKEYVVTGTLFVQGYRP